MVVVAPPAHATTWHCKPVQPLPEPASTVFVTAVIETPASVSVTPTEESISVVSFCVPWQVFGSHGSVHATGDDCTRSPPVVSDWPGTLFTTTRSPVHARHCEPSQRE